MNATTTNDVHGPIDFILLEFPSDRLTGEASRALADLVERGVVRLYDLMVLSKGEDETVEVLELTNPALGAGSFSSFSELVRVSLGENDIEEAAAVMKPGTVAALIVYENTCAIPGSGTSGHTRGTATTGCVRTRRTRRRTRSRSRHRTRGGEPEDGEFGEST